MASSPQTSKQRVQHRVGNSAAREANNSARRPVIPISYPASANTCANARPMPDVAPTMTHRFTLLTLLPPLLPDAAVIQLPPREPLCLARDDGFKQTPLDHAVFIVLELNNHEVQSLSDRLYCGPFAVAQFLGADGIQGLSRPVFESAANSLPQSAT